MTGAPRRALTVLHVDTERGWRGGEQHILWLAEALRRLGHTSLIAARPDEPLARRARERGFSILPVRPRTELAPIAARHIHRAIDRDAIDVVHAHTAHAVALGGLAVRRTAARLVVTRHIDFTLQTNPFSRWKYGRASAIIAVSEGVARSLSASGIGASRVTVIPGGVDLHHVQSPASDETLRILGVPLDAPLVVLVAALVPQKDPVTFVRAMALARQRVPGAHALIVGEGPLRRDVEAVASSLGASDAIHFAGYRDDADTLLARATVVALSSRNEGLPVVLMNALALGKPIAATAAGGIPEMITRGQCGIVVPVGDAAALGDAIARLLEDSALRARFGAAARAHAAEYSIDRVAELTVAVYRRTIERTSAVE
ncbi:MAG: glycosyltransferase [Gemmatimonadaceae bacterium]